jgi:hypothetical protein
MVEEEQCFRVKDANGRRTALQYQDRVDFGDVTRDPSRSRICKPLRTCFAPLLQEGQLPRLIDAHLAAHRAVRFTGRWEKGTGFMPLRRGKAIGYDADLMAFKFTMRNGQQIVQCQISTAALSDLADRRRGSKGDLLAEFKARRVLIEAIASALFDQSSNEKTRVVSIFSKHIPTSRFGRRHTIKPGSS